MSIETLGSSRNPKIALDPQMQLNVTGSDVRMVFLSILMQKHCIFRRAFQKLQYFQEDVEDISEFWL